MKFLILPFIFISLLPFSIFSAPIDSATARTVALHFVNQLQDNKHYFSRGEIVEKPHQWLNPKNSQYYFFKVGKNHSYVIISGDDATFPVLAYSISGELQTDGVATTEMPFAMTELLKDYARQIDEIRQAKISGNPSIAADWQKYLGINSKTSGTKALVDPLLICTWNQGAPYNALCPEDAAGPGGRVYAGCVATAMAMTMYYYRFPNEGTGSHGYNSSYGYLSVNFAESVYHFNSMPTYINYGSSYDIAKLQYDCGVAVDMMYSPNGSGAFMEDAANAMRSYFKYNPGLQLVQRSNYTDADWISLLKAQINAGQPLPYAAYDESAGHAFVCDGYDSGDFFHFNWGWSGAYNGYFFIDNLNPGYNFNWGHQCIIDAYPAGTSYPRSCVNDVMTTSSGSIVVGMTKGNYLDNQNCSWQIAPPDSISYIRLVFQYLNTQLGHDTISIYEGMDESGTLIGSYSGNSIPSAINIPSSKVFVTFKSDESTTDRGFVLDYYTVSATFCQSLTLLTDTNGIITDGSGSYKYHPNSLCRWKINAPGAQGYLIHFNDLDLETNSDFVKICESGPTGLIEKASYTGSSVPNEEYFPYPSILILFKTNGIIENNGFTLQYHSLFTGIEDEKLPESGFSISSGSESYLLTLVNLPQGDYDLGIYDVNGRIIFTEKVSVNSSFFRQTLPFSKPEPGSYFARIVSKERSLSTQFIIY